MALLLLSLFASVLFFSCVSFLSLISRFLYRRCLSVFLTGYSRNLIISRLPLVISFSSLSSSSGASRSFLLLFLLSVLFVLFVFRSVRLLAPRLFSSFRILVGLRWWNEIREDGSNEWRFESKAVGKKCKGRKMHGNVFSFMLSSLLSHLPVIYLRCPPCRTNLQ